MLREITIYNIPLPKIWVINETPPFLQYMPSQRNKSDTVSPACTDSVDAQSRRAVVGHKRCPKEDDDDDTRKKMKLGNDEIKWMRRKGGGQSCGWKWPRRPQAVIWKPRLLPRLLPRQRMTMVVVNDGGDDDGDDHDDGDGDNDD